MTMTLVPTHRDGHLSPALPDDVLDDIIDKGSQRTLSDSTRRAYRHWWDRFEAFTLQLGKVSLPAESRTISLFILYLEDEGLSLNSIKIALTAVRVAHDRAQVDPNPGKGSTVKATIEAVTSRHPALPPNRKAGLLVGHVRMYLQQVDDGSLRACRDRAILLAGFALASRRSELVALDVADLAPDIAGTGYFVTIRRSKTDQRGAGSTKHLLAGVDPVTDPAGAVREWLFRADISEGPVFRPISTGGAVVPRRLGASYVATVVKQAAAALNFKPEQFGGHSLRRGFVTSAANSGSSARSIMRQTGHKSLQMVQTYVDECRADLNNAVADLGL